MVDELFEPWKTHKKIDLNRYKSFEWKKQHETKKKKQKKKNITKLKTVEKYFDLMRLNRLNKAFRPELIF